ncbi:LytTR family DNA-binding domain-containing protein [Hymenobacter ginsengisoli]|uniref:LytTR family DNA-binding domain-containing protein n=1 Tax=Hymenobacter ginsengisoli TaxID=1051626 RepID=A0ABP8QLY7_9BACT|nr:MULTISPECIES: LytTR family DNA-binding domain-containing protein [unclassified Hymenobacter]MBO2031268.1 response regulator transcription factor [Hymenobacter sp. BT559]
MLRALLVEDEPLAARRLASLLQKQAVPFEILGPAESVAQAVALLQAGPAPDVLFLDIHLADGLSFELFEQVTVTCPVVFTTAYDQYAVRAFKVNSVDYLLKPIDEEEIRQAVVKLQQRLPIASRGDFSTKSSVSSTKPAAENGSSVPGLDAATLAALLQQLRQPAPVASYKSQFVVRVGEHLKVVPVEQVAYFFSLEKTTLLQSTDGRKYVVDYTMEQLEGLLDPSQFFRLNRAFLARQAAIADIIHYTNSRLQTILKPAPPESEGPVLVSREKVSVFKNWLDR